MNQQQTYIRWGITISVLLLLLCGVVLLSLSSGEIPIKLSELFAVLQNKSSLEYSVLTNIRLPRILLAFAVGGTLSMTGAILQGIYRNPLVEPYTLGISGGAALGVSLCIVFHLHEIGGSFMLPASGFAGALTCIFLVYSLSMAKGIFSVNKMLLMGVMISFIASSSMMFLMSISNSDDVHSIIFWIMGSLDESNSGLINLMLYSSIGGLLIAYLFSHQLNALRLGEQSARHLGINTGLTIKVLFVMLSLLTGLCVSIAGIIGFVGLIIPHVVKRISGSDYRILLPASFMGGSIFLMLSDVVARTIISPNELPIGVITGMVGGVLFLVVLKQTKSQ